MAGTKALSPEIQQLLEKVRKQAELYDKAFEYFESQRKEFENIKFMLDIKEKDFTSYFENLKKNIENFKNKNIDEVERSIKNINEEFSKIKNINENIDIINQYKDKLEKDVNKINKEFINFRKEFDRLATDSASQIEILSKDMKNELDANIEKLQNNVDLMMTELKEDLINKIDNIENFAKILKIQLNETNDKINLEVLIRNKKIEKEINRFDEYLTHIRDEIKKNEEELSAKIVDVKFKITKSLKEEIIEELTQKLKFKFFTKDEFKAEKESNDIDFLAFVNELKKDIEILDNIITKTKLRFNMTLFVALASIIGIIIMFLIYFSNL